MKTLVVAHVMLVTTIDELKLTWYYFSSSTNTMIVLTEYYVLHHYPYSL